MASKGVFTNLKMKDTEEGYTIRKEDMPNVPFRMIFIGKSSFAGKTNLAGNLICRPLDNNDVYGLQCYANDFKGRNTYICTPSADSDKWAQIIKVRGIPESNIFRNFDEAELDAWYERIKEKFQEDDETHSAEHVLIIFDDVSFSGALKNKWFGVISKIFCNGRHYLISAMIMAQKYSDVSTTARENASALMLFECSRKQGELIYADHGKVSKKLFLREFEKEAVGPGNFMGIIYSNPPHKRFVDSTFSPIKRLCNWTEDQAEEEKVEGKVEGKDEG